VFVMVQAAFAFACEDPIRATITNSTPGIVAALLAEPRTGTDNANRPGALFDESNTTAIAAVTANVYLASKALRAWRTGRASCRRPP
jgi:hypothetical protein